jgi:hypothetical protein
MKITDFEIQKGGPGSGVQGHITMRENGDRVHQLNNKILQLNPFKDQLNKLKNGAVWEGVKTSSGKPVFNDINQAIAHGYQPEDFKDAGNLHYEHAQRMADQIEKLNKLDQPIPREMKELEHHHMRAFKQNFNAADKLSNRMKRTETVIKESGKVKKSVTSMLPNDSLEVDTSKFAIESKLSQEHELTERLQRTMEDYSYGDEPRLVSLDKGDLYLTKVDDGVYSGYIRLSQMVNNPDAESMQLMEDNSKVRIERMTIPTLVNFLIAKEFIKQSPIALPEPSPMIERIPEVIEMKPEQVESLTLKLEQPIKVESDLDKKIRILELINRLTT